MATFPHDYTTKLPKCVIRVEDNMYDVTAFRNTHPGGAEILDLYHEKDATDVFYAFHSKAAIAQMKRFKGKEATAKDPQRDQISLDFEKLRRNLESNGWFERNWLQDFGVVILPCVTFLALGIYFATTSPLLASVCLGIGMQQCGWIGHDYGHGRGTASWYLNYFFGAFVNGFSSQWWSHKHNTHHAFPNRLDVDADIHNEPIMHLWFPSKEKDVWYRKYQHYYYLFAYSFLYASWRFQSILFVIGSKDKKEIAMMVAGYSFWLWVLPPQVFVGGILVGGWLVAVVVTANHQPEPMLETNSKYNYMVDQVVTTRGVVCYDPFTEYLFGGMQYQLEHHLFPIMPKYRYAAVRPILSEFIEKHGLEYKVSSIPDIMARNYAIMKKFSQ